MILPRFLVGRWPECEAQESNKDDDSDTELHQQGYEYLSNQHKSTSDVIMGKSLPRFPQDRGSESLAHRWH